MQIKGLHKNIYKLYAYARTQECLDGTVKLIFDSVIKKRRTDKGQKNYLNISMFRKHK